MKKSAAEKKIGKVMGEYKAGKLHSGKGGPTVTSKKQAMAIAMSEAGRPLPKRNERVTRHKAKK